MIGHKNVTTNRLWLRDDLDDALDRLRQHGTMQRLQRTLDETLELSFQPGIPRCPLMG